MTTELVFILDRSGSMSGLGCRQDLCAKMFADPS